VPKRIIVTGDPRFLNPAVITRWVDADTVDARVELPFHHLTDQRFRLFGINAYEHNTPAGKFATILVNELLPAGWPCSIRSYKDPDSFGRWLAIIVTPAGLNLNQQLITEGLAFPYFGGDKPIMPEWPGPIKGTLHRDN
jgi:endonuclease YncB( thermonuclease family)